jgi:hypothetical protein
LKSGLFHYGGKLYTFGGFTMLTIQRNYWKDLAHAKEVIEFGIKQPTKVELYRAIASHLDISADGLDIDQLWAAIDARNMELAVVGIAETLVETESTVVDKMAATIDRPFKRVAVPPVKRPMPVVKGGLSAATARPGVVVGRSRSIQRPIKNGVVV